MIDPKALDDVEAVRNEIAHAELCLARNLPVAADRALRRMRVLLRALTEKLQASVETPKQ